MMTWNDLKTLDLSSIDLGRIDPTKIDLTRFDIRKIELPTFELPKIDLPKPELPKLPQVEIPADVDRAAGFARDAAYAGVGAAVVAARKIDGRRRELTGQVTARLPF